MEEQTPGTFATERMVDMTYAERLAWYEKEKMLISKSTNSKTYEEQIKSLAKKWKI